MYLSHRASSKITPLIVEFSCLPSSPKFAECVWLQTYLLSTPETHKDGAWSWRAGWSWQTLNNKPNFVNARTALVDGQPYKTPRPRLWPPLSSCLAAVNPIPPLSGGCSRKTFSLENRTPFLITLIRPRKEPAMLQGASNKPDLCKENGRKTLFQTRASSSSPYKLPSRKPNTNPETVPYLVFPYY